MDHLFRLIRRLTAWTTLLGLLLWTGLATPTLKGAEFFGLIGNKHVDLSGFGFFGDIELTRALEILEPQDEKLTTFDSIYLEDALWILSGELKRRGYLYPSIDASLSKEGTVLWSGTWDEDGVDPALPQGLEGDYVTFTIRRGVLFYFNIINAEGIPSEVTRLPASFFYQTDRLIVTEDARFYSEGRMATGRDNIILALRDIGYRDAKAETKVTEIHRDKGGVDIDVTVTPGPLYFVESLTVDAPDDEVYSTLVDFTFVEDEQRLTPDWVQAHTQVLRNAYFKAGYPEVLVTTRIEPLNKTPEEVQAAVTIVVEPGPKLRIAGVRFENTGGTDPELLARQADLEDGELLNRTKVEAGRDRLSRLNVFRSIRIDYEDTDEGERTVVYTFVPKEQTVVNLIMGVGSFDIVRGGFEVIQNNLWGLAHHSRMSAIQSFKGTYVDYTYTIPQIFGEDLDFFLTANYLRREEITFDREEYGGSAGLQHYFSDINTATSIQYNYGLVEARNSEFQVPPGPTESLVSSITLKASRSEIDNPVFPTDGWQVFGTSEFALTQLGGHVEFQRIEVGGAWHKPVTDSGLVFHAGYKTGVVTSFGPSSENIPVPKRFFLGGENTVRGYRRDQASPVNAEGQQIGAVSYMLLQVEFEQRLTELFSVVAFADTVGNAANIQDYPFNQVLMSVGGGISLRTVVGPLRFEYGHNVKKRPDDPSGTFQVALGFPF